ncbi:MULTISPECIES: hypothetical protein [Nocardia]|uniref:hypothetical protein n=1 Tax=Nocardia TaxID=1817 RepID=UPI0013585136|nr:MULTISPECIES: hypothetical protein [Nocardia]
MAHRDVCAELPDIEKSARGVGNATANIAQRKLADRFPAVSTPTLPPESSRDIVLDRRAIRVERQRHWQRINNEPIESIREYPTELTVARADTV